MRELKTLIYQKMMSESFPEADNIEDLPESYKKTLFMVQDLVNEFQLSMSETDAVKADITVSMTEGNGISIQAKLPDTRDVILTFSVGETGTLKQELAYPADMRGTGLYDMLEAQAIISEENIQEFLDAYGQLWADAHEKFHLRQKDPLNTIE